MNNNSVCSKACCENTKYVRKKNHWMVKRSCKTLLHDISALSWVSTLIHYFHVEVDADVELDEMRIFCRNDPL